MKKVCVVGFGISGIGASSLLLNLGFEVYVTHSMKKDVTTGLFSSEMNFNFIHKNEAIEKIKKGFFEFMVVSPSVSMEDEIVATAKSKNLLIKSELELGAENYKGKIVAITGTNGKTTTSTLMYEILKECNVKTDLVGNVGKPITQMNEDMDENSIAVVEVSSFQLENIDKFKPYISTILNIAPDHLDRHKTMEEYVSCKKKIFKNATKDDCIIINSDQKIIKDITSVGNIQAQKICFSVSDKNQDVFCEEEKIFIKNQEAFFMDKSDINILGEHNLSNVLTCIAISNILGLNKNLVVKAIKNFKGLPHRMEFIKELSGVKFYNDSKGTNISATISAIESVKGKVVLILGGSNKGYEYDEIFLRCGDFIDYVVAFGQTSQKILEASRRCGFKNIILASSLKESVLLAYYKARTNSIVLFSPASASFDMFSSYVERGEAFVQIVRGLI